jgi:hypothetical protein
LTSRIAPLVQLSFAVGGGAIGLLGVLAALDGAGPAPSWVIRLFAGWCVVTPYWWYLEHRLFAPSEPGARAEFDSRQSYSRLVWLGVALAMGVPILARAG